MSRFIYYYAKCHYAECHYPECRYAECRYAECRGASRLFDELKSICADRTKNGARATKTALYFCSLSEILSRVPVVAGFEPSNLES